MRTVLRRQATSRHRTVLCTGCNKRYITVELVRGMQEYELDLTAKEATP